MRTKCPKDKFSSRQSVLKTKFSEDKVSNGQSVQGQSFQEQKSHGTKFEKESVNKKISLGKYSYSTWFCTSAENGNAFQNGTQEKEN